MDRIAVVANPVASQFTGGSHRSVMAELARSHDVEALWPASGAAAPGVARAAIDQGASVVVAMGGDGMVHHVAQALIGSRVALGIVPAGTTNVVARLFGIPSRQVKAARLIGRHEPETVGTARLTLTRGDTHTEHHALFACGLGLDAEVVRVADSDPYRKYRFGSLHYARSAIGVGLGRFPRVKPNVEFLAEGHEAKGTTALIQFRDSYSYFGRISLRFDQSPEPMSALILERLRRIRVPRIFFTALFHGELGRIEGFQLWPDLKWLDFTADPPVAAQADGEGLGLVDGGRVEWAAASLRIITGP